jgi:MFS family permease
MPGDQNWKFALRALRHPNYRLYFTGQSVSLAGTWMTRVATSWLVYRLTDSPFLLGVVSFAGQIPTLLLGPLAGVWTDRLNRHRALVATQTLLLVHAAVLAALTLSGRITVAEVIGLMVLQGIVNALDMPLRQSFLVLMVEDRADLSNAIALNSSMVNASRLVGPAVAGLLIAASGEGWCFLIDAISYLAVIASLLAMNVQSPAPRATGRRVGEEMLEGWRYVSSSVPIRSALALVALISLVGMPYTVLMPVVAKQILHGGAHTLGFLMAASGLGALFAGALLAARRSLEGLGRQIALATALFGAGLVAFAWSTTVWLSLMLLLVTGFGFVTQLAGSNTILQTVVSEEKRGRVMSYHAMAFQGVAPFGSLAAGAVAAKLGVSWTLTAAGMLCVLGALWYARRLPAVRRAVMEAQAGH